MRVLITGREGQLARSLLVRGAGAPGIELVALGRPELDLERPETIEPAISAAAPEIVVAAAAYTAVDQAEDEPERAFRVNGEAAGEVAAAARRCGARLIHVSTDFVFDGEAAAPYREEDPTGPVSVYGRSKLDGERRVLAAGGDCAIVRTAWVYSPYGRNFVRTMLRVAAGRDEVRVVADQRGSPTSAWDLADGLLHMIRAWSDGAAPARLYHLAGSSAGSWFEVAERVFAARRATGRPTAPLVPVTTADWPVKARRPAYSALDSRAFERDFGFAMPDWRGSVDAVAAKLLETEDNHGG